VIKQRIRKQGLKGEEGVAMVEFAILVTLLLVILLGIIQFGLMWFTKYVITCAAREGAHYATVYTATTNPVTHIQNRIPPVSLTSPTVVEVVTNYANNLLRNTPVTVTPSGTGWTSTVSGTDVTIQVSCQNPWNLLGGFIPSLSNITLSAQVTMKNE
jgi:Flp pilus assembly protein TadG